MIPCQNAKHCLLHRRHSRNCILCPGGASSAVIAHRAHLLAGFQVLLLQELSSKASILYDLQDFANGHLFLAEGHLQHA